jgi:hypothetical protein
MVPSAYDIGEIDDLDILKWPTDGFIQKLQTQD